MGQLGEEGAFFIPLPFPLSLGREVWRRQRDRLKEALPTPHLHTSCDGQLITSQGSLCWISKLEFLRKLFQMPAPN